MTIFRYDAGGLVCAFIAFGIFVWAVADIRRGDVKPFHFIDPIYRDAQPGEFWVFIGYKLFVSLIALAMALLAMHHG